MRRLIFSRTPAALQYGSPASSAWLLTTRHSMTCLNVLSGHAWRWLQILMQQSLQVSACWTDLSCTGQESIILEFDAIWSPRHKP